MTTAPTKPITSKERLFLSMAVDDALLVHLGESLPYNPKCSPITSVKELERRFVLLDWAASLISAAARAGVHATQYDVPYAQFLADATSFVRAAEAMTDWLTPSDNDTKEALSHCSVCEAPITDSNPEPWGEGAGCEACQGGAKGCR